MIHRQYIEAIAYKHLHKEVLLMDRLVVEERERWKNPGAGSTSRSFAWSGRLSGAQ